MLETPDLRYFGRSE
jgi:ubiquitin-activating enzyme E1